MKILNLIFLTATVATVLLSSSSSSGKVDAFDPDCWRGLTSWFSMSCNSNSDCPSDSWCFSGRCIILCEKYCSSDQYCYELSTNSVRCCTINYRSWLNLLPEYVCEYVYY
ncbi:uncharacterized protein LOC123267377 [Cotesia glomerata]|uniref:uncharacterized protein LOC123267377 n=1 Tax=Cotesia glomerata TaxID=32391 RepID=UPI001D009227|nr:uncharacterized protein LOC123267377 [Cotesia glomerata]